MRAFARLCQGERAVGPELPVELTFDGASVSLDNAVEWEGGEVLDIADRVAFFDEAGHMLLWLRLPHHLRNTDRLTVGAELMTVSDI